MYELAILSHFAAAHQLRKLGGECEQLHGHNWKVEVTVTSRRLGRDGIVLDFGVLKKELAKILEPLDHAFLNSIPFFSRKEPSSEMIARYIFKRLSPRMKRYKVTLKSVTAWESENARATYTGRR